MREDALTQAQAWSAFDAFTEVSGAKLLDEPMGLDRPFRQLTDRQEVSTKQWADAYLAAFAKTAHLTLVTFDRALAATVEGAILLA